jgi:hypothetical protein
MQESQTYTLKLILAYHGDVESSSPGHPPLALVTEGAGLEGKWTESQDA